MDFFKLHMPWVISVVSALVLVAGYFFTIAPPSDFPPNSIVVISRGENVLEIAQKLADEHIVARPSLLRFVLRIAGAGTVVQAGAYLFKNPQNLLIVAYRLVAGAYNIPPVRITLPEGITVRESAKIISEELPGISASDFITEAKQYEGYLFPDTYTFQPGAETDSVIASMRDNFNVKIATLSDTISASGHSLSDVVIMASLLEKEARTTEVRRVVSGILWRRLALGMPLQVDAVFGYIFNRDTYSPSYADLKVDSPYNTYLHTGLPPGPINNPGLDALGAAATPTKTDYLYYLVDKNGIIHYATTYSAHQTNQRKYLK